MSKSHFFLAIFIFSQAYLFAQNPCTISSWGTLLSNDCGDIQASGGLSAGSPVIFCEGQTVTVENNSSPISEIQTTYIDWGDGVCQTFNGFQMTMTHAYDFPNDTCIQSSDGTIIFNIRLGVEKKCANNLRSFNSVNFDIKVRFKPIAAFAANPQTACINTPVDFTNNSCENTNNPIYKWTMGNGEMFSTENVLDYIYPNGGTYTVSFSVSNSCGTSTFAQIISVLPPATADATASDTEICAGETITFTNSSTNASAQNPYQWTVSPSLGVVFVPPSNSGSVSPTIRFNTPGTYTVRLKVNGCGMPMWETVITVLAPASIGMAPLPDLCAGTANTIAPMPSIGGVGTTVGWTFAGGSPASSNANIPGIITYPGGGTYIITATATNLCNSTTYRDTFVIAPLATAAAAISDDTLCGPSELLEITNLSANAFSTNSYSWSVAPTIGAAFTGGTSAGSTNPQLTFGQAGTYTISLAVNGCGSPIWDTTVLVLLSPLVTVATIPDGCVDVTLNPLDYATLANADNTTVQWVFGGGTPATATGLMPGPVLFSGFSSHTISVTVANVCGMASAIDSFQITPVEAVSATSAGPFCSAEMPINLQSMPPNGTWSGVGVNAAGLFTPANAPLNQTTQLVYAVGSGSCLVTDTIAVLVQGTLINAGPDQAVCSNTSAITLSGFSPAGGGWSGDSVSVSGVFYPAFSGNGPNALTYTFTDAASGCVNTDQVVVSVLGVPAASLDSIGRTCVNEPLDFGPFSGGIGVSACAWDFGDNTNAVICAPVHTYNSPGNYIITLIVSNSVGCKDTTSTQIQVVTPPNAVFVTDTTMGCADLPIDITQLSTINDYTQYIWNYGFGLPDTILNPGTITYLQGETDTTYTIVLTAENGCGTAKAMQAITVFPRPQVRFGSDVSSGCTPLEVNFNNVTVGNPDFYRWYVNGTFVDTGFQLPQQVFLAIDNDSTYFIMLIAGNECGFDTVIHTVIVHPNPVLAFFNTDTLVGCLPFSVQLTDYSTQGIYISWDLGDGTLASGDTVWHTYAAAGTYLVQEYVNNGCGFDTAEISITVLPQPLVSFEHQPFVCHGDTLFLANTSPAVAGSYWDFGDGTTDSTLTQTRHVYAMPGQYTITMTGVAVTTGCPATITSIVEVKQLPVPVVNLPDSSGCQPFALVPTNSTTGNNTYVWTFGDGSVSIAANGLHNYTQAGSYALGLIVTDFYGCTAVWSQQPIQVYPKPDAQFATQQDQLCVTPTVVTFSNQSVDADAYQWDFGSFGQSIEVSPSIMVGASASIAVHLQVVSQYGCRDTIKREVRVYTAPNLDFMVENTRGCAPYYVLFENNSMGVNLYKWDFGDGAISSEASPFHLYESAGQYTVVLYAAADSVCFDSLRFQSYITVLPSPLSAFTYAPVADTTVVPNGIIRFTDQSINAIRWHWDFGDGDTSALRNPVHRYFITGPKTVRLITYNSLGCPDTAWLEILPDFFGNLFIPNALAPESGNIKESIFMGVGLGLIEFSLSVFASNGQRVWHSDALQDGQPTESWNGRMNNTGELLPQGIYWWKAFARFENGTIWRGMVTEEGAAPAVEGKVLLIR